MRETEHIRDFTLEEIANSWYSKPEYRMMRRDIMATVGLIVRGVPVDDDDDEEYCTRGVEFRTPKGSHRRKQRKLHSVLAVLDEQAEQELTETGPHPEALSLVYSRASAICREEAANRGKLDAVAAARIHGGGHENLTPELLRKITERGKNL